MIYFLKCFGQLLAIYLLRKGRRSIPGKHLPIPLLTENLLCKCLLQRNSFLCIQYLCVSIFLFSWFRKAYSILHCKAEGMRFYLKICILKPSLRRISNTSCSLIDSCHCKQMNCRSCSA